MTERNPEFASSAPASVERRPTNMRLAHAHLRLGHFALARAELETAQQRGELDVEALADLAQARWRTGDLARAGQAAQAHLEAGGEDPTSLVIAAESALADGRVGDARELAERARQRSGDLEAIFAGQRRSRVWRAAEPAEASPGAPAAAPPVAETLHPPPGAGEEAPLAPASAREARAVGGPRSAVELPAADRASTTARELIAFAAAALRDDPGRAAVELAIVLRLEPSLAPAVLELVARREDGRPSRSAAALEIVRGDAYRLIGRPREAEQAYARAGAVLGSLGGMQQ